MFSTERLFAVADAANVAYLVGKKKAQNTVALDRSCRAQRSPCDRTKGASEENPVKLGTWPLIEIGQSRSKGTCWQPWENFMRSGATTALASVAAAAGVATPAGDAGPRLFSLRSCVNCSSTSLSSSMRRCGDRCIKKKKRPFFFSLDQHWPFSFVTFRLMKPCYSII